MKKYLSLVLLTLLIILTPFEALGKPPAAPPQQPDTFNLKCRSALLMEYSSGKIIYEYKPHEKFSPASVTKVMTMLLAMEAVDSGKLSLKDKVTISENAKHMGGSTMYLETGEIRTLEDLIKGVAVESANDAAVAVAEYIGGSEGEFVKLMNNRAKELGMKDTNFVNCMGFYDPNHYTSANDIAIMSKELIKHRKILEYTSIWMETISEGRKEPFTLVNRNKMIKRYSGCDGLKTGFTKESMYCISATAKRGNIRFISVIMGADSWKERNAQAERLMDYGFSKFQSVNVVKAQEPVYELQLTKSKPEKVNVVAKDDLSVIFEKGKKVNVVKKFELKDNIKLPLKKGDVVGIIKAYDGDNLCGQVEAVVNEDVKKINFSDALKKGFKNWINLE